MKGKRIGTSVLAALMLAGTTATSALAAMPDKTAVIGEKAFALSYVNASENETEIREAIIASKKANQKIYVKARNVWYNNDESKLADTSVIPAVVYKTADSEVSYEAGDGEEATEGFMIKEISATGVRKITVAFTEAVSEKDREKASFEVKKNSKTKNFNKVEWNEEATEAYIALDSKITKGEYAVEVKGLELDDTKRTFAAESEKVADIVIKSGEEIPQITLGSGEAKTYQVNFKYEVQNQYGEEVSYSVSPEVYASFDSKDKAKAGKSSITLNLEKNLFENILVKDFPLSATIIVNDNNNVVSKQYMGKIVKNAMIKSGEFGETFKMNSKSELVKIEGVTESKDKKKSIYMALDLVDQYGNKVDYDFFKARGMVSTNQSTLTAAKLDAIAEYENFSFTAGTKTEDPIEFVFNTKDGNDKTLYAKITRTFENLIPVNVMMVVGADVNNTTVAVDESKIIDTMNIELPEIIVAGEKAEFETIEAFDKNGDAIEGKDLFDKIVKDGAINEDIISTNNGTIVASYDETNEKVKLYWDFTKVQNNGKYDKTISFQVRTQTNKYNSVMGNLKPDAVATEISLKRTSIDKMVPGATQTINLKDDVVVYDQYERAMKASKVAKEGTVKITNVAMDAVGKAIEKSDTDKTVVNREWTIKGNAGGAKTTTGAVKLYVEVEKDGKKVMEMVSETDVRATTVDNTDVVELKLEASDKIYGGATALTNKDYNGSIEVYGKTEDGSKVILTKGVDYKLGTGSDNFNLDTAGKIKVVTEFKELGTDKETTVNVYANAVTLENADNTPVESVTVSIATPELTTFKVDEDKTVVTFEKATFTVKDLMGYVVAEDQYGVALPNNPTLITVNKAEINKAAKTHNRSGKELAGTVVVAEGLKNGDNFVVKAFYGSESVTFKVIVDNIK